MKKTTLLHWPLIIFFSALFIHPTQSAPHPLSISPGQKPSVWLFMVKQMTWADADRILPVFYPSAVQLRQYYTNSTDERLALFGLLTGRYPTTIGPHQVLRTPQKESETPFLMRPVTLGQLFMQSGYETRHYGKWAFPTNDTNRLPLDMGYANINTSLIEKNGPSHPTAKQYVKKTPKQHFTQFWFETLEEFTQFIKERKRSIHLRARTDTLVIFTAATSGPALYESDTHVPFVALGPGFFEGVHDTSTQMSHIDMIVTLSNLTRFLLPSPLLFDGEDFSSAFYGKPEIRTDPLFWEKRNPAVQEPQFAIRKENWKLLEYPTGRLELHDVRRGFEIKDLLESEKELGKSLHSELKKFKARLLPESILQRMTDNITKAP